MPRDLQLQSFPGRTLAASHRAFPFSPSRRRLIELIYRLQFGRIEQLPIVHGEPHLDAPGVRLVEEHKFPREPQSRASKIPEAHWLKAQVLEFCELLDQQPNVTLMSLDIRHGTPFRVLIATTSSTSQA